MPAGGLTLMVMDPMAPLLKKGISHPFAEEKSVLTRRKQVIPLTLTSAIITTYLLNRHTIYSKKKSLFEQVDTLTNLSRRAAYWEEVY